MMKKEIWRPIPNYEGLYEVSNKGRLKALPKQNGFRYSKEKILNPSLHHDGYLQTALLKNNIRKTVRIANLVADTFIPNPYNLPQINHKNHDKTDNRVENLERTDNLGNTINDSIWRKKCNVRKILQYNLNGNFIKEWISTYEIERKLGFNQSHIEKCCKGKHKTAYGYIWKYKEE